MDTTRKVIGAGLGIGLVTFVTIAALSGQQVPDNGSSRGLISYSTALTNNSIPRAVGTNKLQNSGFSDNGSTITGSARIFALTRTVDATGGAQYINLINAQTGQDVTVNMMLDNTKSMVWTSSSSNTAYIWKDSSSVEKFRFANSGLALFTDDVGTAVTAGNLFLIDSTSMAQGVGGGVCFQGSSTGTTAANFACIKSAKTNGTDANASADLVFSTRLQGVGSVAEIVRFTNNASMIVTGADPAVSACGTSPTIIGSNIAGTVTIGTGGSATACTVTFANSGFPTNAPACILTSQMSARTDLYISAISTTAFTVSNGAGAAWPASGKFSFTCIGV